MIAIIKDEKYIYFDNITEIEHNILDEQFTVKHPNARYMDIGVPSFDGSFHKYNRFKQRLARPLLHELKIVCEKFKLPLIIQDERPPSSIPVPKPELATEDLLHGIKLDRHQIEAVKATCVEEVGIIACPTGGGKSEIMAGITKIHDCNTVLLCDMTVVVDQLKHRLELRDVASEIGMFYAGKRPNGHKIIVGSFQSLVIPSEPKKTEYDTPESYSKKLIAYKTRRKNARTLREIIGKCDLLLVDECDGCSSKQWRNLFFYWYKGRRRYGFSGTPFDPSKPVQNLTLKENLGSIIHTTDRRELEKIGRIIPVRYTAMAVGDPFFIKDKSALDIATNEHIISNKEFHDLIKKITERELSISDNHGVLILVESIPLGNALEALIEGSKFICGEHSMKHRKQAVKDFESRKCRVLIGGKIVKRGLDLKGGCESLIIATGGKLASDFNQKVGRAVRINKMGKANIYDFFFLGNHYLYSHSKNRLKSIVALGYPAKVVFRNGVVDAEKFIRSRFRRPK